MEKVGCDEEGEVKVNLMCWGWRKERKIKPESTCKWSYTDRDGTLRKS
jgi:hypothetical protein